MEPTNNQPPTPSVGVLTDDALALIEARWISGASSEEEDDENMGALIHSLRVARAERDALRDSASLVAFQAHQIDGKIADSLMASAATRMRQACVATLKRWCKCGPRIHCSFCRIRKEVESLTLDSVAEKGEDDDA